MMAETLNEPDGFTDPGAFYRAMFERRSEAELDRIARVKRFRERLIGDGAFRAALRSGREPPTDVFRRFRVPGDAEGVRPLWDLDLGNRVWSQSELRAWPDVYLWKSWHEDLTRYRSLSTALPSRACSEDRFVAWRDRQMRRAKSEIGAHHSTINHPLVAYELARGCSIGCWFCGVAASEFRGASRFNEEAGLWRGMLTVMVDRFGKAAQTGFCYWATDPVDCPDYDLFAEEHASITGCLPQATTAAPLRDPAFTRRLLAQAERYRTAGTRFSVTTLRQLHGIFETFTARELLGVELVMQMKHSLMPKAVAGRARDTGAKSDACSTEATTIACVTGFLVNLPDRTIRLISPCSASDRWPLGYRVHAEASFTDTESYRAAVDRMIEDHMSSSPLPGQKLVIRDDLIVQMEPNHVVLSNRHTRYALRGHPCIKSLLALLADGPMLPGDLISQLAAQGHDIFTSSAVLDDLFAQAFVEPAIVDPPLVAPPMRRVA